MYRSYSQLGAPEVKNQDQFKVRELKSLEEKNELIMKNRVVCVDVYANWCGPCQKISPIYGRIAKEKNSEGTCIVLKENYDLQLTEDLTAIPTFFIYRDGVLVHKEVGANINNVEQKLDGVLDSVLNEIKVDSSHGPSQYSANSIRRHGSPYSGQTFNAPPSYVSQPPPPQQHQQYPSMQQHQPPLNEQYGQRFQNQPPGQQQFPPQQPSRQQFPPPQQSMYSQYDSQLLGQSRAYHPDDSPYKTSN